MLTQNRFHWGQHCVILRQPLRSVIPLFPLHILFLLSSLSLSLLFSASSCEIRRRRQVRRDPIETCFTSRLWMGGGGMEWKGYTFGPDNLYSVVMAQYGCYMWSPHVVIDFNLVCFEPGTIRKGQSSPGQLASRKQCEECNFGYLTVPV